MWWGESAFENGGNCFLSLHRNKTVNKFRLWEFWFSQTWVQFIRHLLSIYCAPALCWKLEIERGVKPGPLRGEALSVSMDRELVDEIYEAVILCFLFLSLWSIYKHKILYVIYELRKNNKRTNAGHELCDWNSLCALSRLCPPSLLPPLFCIDFFFSSSFFHSFTITNVFISKYLLYLCLDF